MILCYFYWFCNAFVVLFVLDKAPIVPSIAFKSDIKRIELLKMSKNNISHNKSFCQKHKQKGLNVFKDVRPKSEILKLEILWLVKVSDLFQLVR